MITTIDLATTRLLHAEADEALAAVAAKHGLIFKQGRARYDSRSGRVVINGEFQLGSVGGVSRERHDFDANAPVFGCRPEDYKARFTNRGMSYELVGFEPRRSRFPYVGRCVATGKMVLFTASILAQIHRPVAAPAGAAAASA